MTERGRAGRMGRWLAGLLVLVLVAGGSFWAGGVTLRDEAAPAPVRSEALLTDVTDQTVGRVLRYNVSVAWDRVPVAVNVLAGVVTKTGKSGSFEVGDTLYAVNRVPVRVVAGKLPFYRSLDRGAKGSDVAQLRAALRKLGYLTASGGQVYDAATVRAVKAWQKDLGMTTSGTVGEGELVAVAALPSMLSLDTERLRTAAVLAGGEQVVFAPAGDPSFSLELGLTEAQQVPIDATLTVKSGDMSWRAVIAGQDPAIDDTVRFRLAAPEGGVVCSSACGQLPAGQDTVYLPAEVSVIPPVSGPGVPVAAVATKPDGKTVVYVEQAGARVERQITVLGSQDGIAVVDGVAVGERVQVLAAQNTPAPSPTVP